MINPKAHAKQSPTDSPRGAAPACKQAATRIKPDVFALTGPSKWLRSELKRARRGAGCARVALTLAANPRQGAGRPTPHSLAQVRASSRLRATLYGGRQGPPHHAAAALRRLCASLALPASAQMLGATGTLQVPPGSRRGACRRRAHQVLRVPVDLVHTE